MNLWFAGINIIASRYRGSSSLFLRAELRRILYRRIITALGVGFTAVSVYLARKQITVARDQARTQFEDDLAREYREIAQEIPVKALLGEELEYKEYAAALDSLYHYIDLSNTQIFLRQEGRVSAETWNSWREGIAWNLSRPAFYRA